MKKLLFLLFAGLLVTACTDSDDQNGNSDDPNNPGDGSSVLLLLTEEKQNGYFTYNYEYDERNRMIIWKLLVGSDLATIYFTYDDNDRLIGLSRKNGQGIITSEETYYYGNDERPTSGTFSVPGAEDYAVQIQFVYTQNTVIETHITADGIIGNVITYTYDSNGNLVSEQNESANEYSNYLFEFNNFDDKINWNSKWPFAWKQSSVNNYQSYKSTTVNGIQDHIYEYTYNDTGYPIQAEIYDSQTDELIAIREFNYTEAN